jgi:glycosyltransferase involved in cell wall biosynthesis
MHIFYVNARYIPEGVGGPAHSTRFLAEQMVKQGHRATVFCLSARPGITREEMAGVTVIRAGVEVPMLQSAGLFTQALDENRPDLIHSLFPREFPLGVLAQAAQLRGIPIAQTLLSFNLLCHQSFVRGGRNCTSQCAECLINTQAERAYCEQVTAVVGMSRYMLELHERAGLFGSTTNKRVIFDAYEPASPVRPLQSEAGTLRLGYLGRLDPLKGIERLLEALTGPRLSKASWSLKIAGTGAAAYEQILKARYADPRIQFLGFVDPGELLSDIDVLVAPALWEEPFGRIVIEAYAHGVPVIASRRGGMKETVEHGRTGLQFEPERSGELARAIRQCLDAPDMLREMKQQALARWQAEFTPEAVARQYLEVYRSVLPSGV